MNNINNTSSCTNSANLSEAPLDPQIKEALAELIDEGEVDTMLFLASQYLATEEDIEQNGRLACCLLEGALTVLGDDDDLLEYEQVEQAIYALSSLGYLYSQGSGVDDKTKSIICYQRAADLGDTHSMLSLALIYSTDQFGVYNPDMSAYWLAKAQEEGISPEEMPFFNRVFGSAAPAVSYEQDPTLAGARKEDDLFVWQVVRVEAGEESTRVRMSVTPKVAGTMIWSSMGEKLVDSDSGKLYPISHTDLPLSKDDAKVLLTTDTYYFTETYPALPASVRKIDIFDSVQGFYIRNWQLR